MKTPYYIFIFVGYICFGVGMLTGQALASKPIVWIAIMIIAGINCVVMCIPLRKKKLPVRRASRVAPRKLKAVR